MTVTRTGSGRFTDRDVPSRRNLARSLTPRARRNRLVGVVLVAAAAALVLILTSGRSVRFAAKADCASVGTSIRALQVFEKLVHQNFSCVVVFNNAAPDWAGWVKPWFLTRTDADLAWSSWATARGTHRQLVISQNLFPTAVNWTDWLHAGAAGKYTGYAKLLARNLVAAGLGSSVIRLAHEANDTGAPYALVDTPVALTLWRKFWRQTVLAMRSVPGAHFIFDWTINAYWRPIPLSKWYPGDDVVDIVGIDAYDSGVPVGLDRWKRIYNQPDGIHDVLRFAAAHGKPVSLPEWGLSPADAKSLGGGDDPTYVDRMADVVRHNPVAYQAYFFAHESAVLLFTGRLSLPAYRRHFGSGGDTTGAPTITRGS